MRTLHVTNGDSAAGTLRTFLTDRVLVTCDVLHEGPAPLVDGDAWYEVRSRFLTSAFEAHHDGTRASLAAFDRAITEPDRHDEIVLWFEHDLYDQLLLIRTLDVLARGSARLKPGTTETRVSLICIGEFPGVDRFIGLGQLTADQLASLYPARTPVTAAQYSLASDAWRAFRADDPRALHALMIRLRPDAANDTLPFLRGAIHRLFEEYPSTTNGLSRSAEAIARALEAGPMEAGALFRDTQRHEERPFLGDLGHFDIMRALARARTALVTVDPDSEPADLRGRTVTLTQAGRDVLAGRSDALALNGIDEWRGGVHLVGADRAPWRWDRQRETLIS